MPKGQADPRSAMQVNHAVARAMLRKKVEATPFQRRYYIDRDDAFILSRTLEELGLKEERFK